MSQPLTGYLKLRELFTYSHICFFSLKWRYLYLPKIVKILLEISNIKHPNGTITRSIQILFFPISYYYFFFFFWLLHNLIIIVFSTVWSMICNLCDFKNMYVKLSFQMFCEKSEFWDGIKQLYNNHPDLALQWLYSEKITLMPPAILYWQLYGPENKLNIVETEIS